MNTQIFTLWRESLTVISSVYQHAAFFPKSDISGLRSQLEHTAMEYMNQIAEISSATQMREVRIKLAQAHVNSCRISSVLSMAKMAYHIDDLKLQLGIKTLQVLIGQAQATLLAAPTKLSA